MWPCSVIFQPNKVPWSDKGAYWWSAAVLKHSDSKYEVVYRLRFERRPREFRIDRDF
jgi:hypothetical protein